VQQLQSQVPGGPSGPCGPGGPGGPGGPSIGVHSHVGSGNIVIHPFSSSPNIPAAPPPSAVRQEVSPQKSGHSVGGGEVGGGGLVGGSVGDSLILSDGDSDVVSLVLSDGDSLVLSDGLALSEGLVLLSDGLSSHRHEHSFNGWFTIEASRTIYLSSL